ncbi:MAG: ATP-binding protein [Alteromonadaceae bacterium]|uniref:ATP-binding protein n=1 Tax=Marinobacter sp. TaxID=50741 RepID=UPI0029C5A28B|nr:ATP-binding protein [Marinobacter sp.]MDX5388403.1 ATP-binding protein [Marinobacter sp.]MDX5441042.1 ATP-binding protein [Alteromonadaceae bacterium]
MDRVVKQSSPIREVDATPYAASLIEGHRDFGYSLETALADVIDNSISAGSTTIQLIANTAVEEPSIIIADDGSGMSEAELVEAMRLGSKNPSDKRAVQDLGRFGLGLKSASFSQCRSLTVISSQNSKVSCARWDLDRVSQRNDWSLELLDDHSVLPGLDLLPANGTVVVWEKLDRLIGGYGDDRVKRVSHLNEEIGQAERHLRLVFHRFLEGRNPRIRIFLNKRQLKPIDPMASGHPSTQKSPEEVLGLSKGQVRIRCYTLPHHKKMTRDEWDETGGPEGHLKSQGLYIYRENRLIISGGWLGLARQTELTKLCRIAVDIPNTMDSDWKIDVKKASAQLPPQVRERLKKIVEHFVGTSKRTYRRRGQRLVDETAQPIWTRVQKDGQVIFRPNSDHPVFRAYADQLPDDLREGFYRCIKIVGSGLPIATLHAELVGNAESVVADHADEEDLRQLVFTMADALLGSGIPADAISGAMQSHPVLRDNWYVAKKLIEDYLEQSDYTETRA